MSCMFVMQVIVDKLRMEGNVGVEVGNVGEVSLYVCWGAIWSVEQYRRVYKGVGCGIVRSTIERCCCNYKGMGMWEK